MAAAHRQHVHPAPGMGQNPRNLLIGEIAVHHLAAFRRDLGRRGLSGVGLVDIGFPETIQGLLGILLAESGKPPGTDGGTDEMQRFAALLEKMFKQQTVQVIEHQPFRAAGRSGQHPDTFRPQSLVADQTQGLGAGLDDEAVLISGHREPLKNLNTKKDLP